MGEIPTSGAGDVVARFEVRHRAYIGSDGRHKGPLPGFANPAASLVPLYRAMVRVRAFDAKAVALQRTGRLGTYAVSLGEEAVSVGVAAAMRADDVLLGYYRQTGAHLWRGVKMEELLQYWGGDERGSDFSGSRQDFAICVPIAAQAPHAAGVAYAFKLRGEDRVAVCILGEGATSKGDAWEAMNFAGVSKLPLVFIVSNNQWAISVPSRLQTAAATYAQKAIAAGIPGEQVDGNDVIAVRAAAVDALDRARKGEGPSLIEAVTYRLGDHTTADDARRYRPDGEVKAHWKLEPLVRLRAYLVTEGAWTKADEEALVAGCQHEVDAAAERYLAIAPRAPATMFDHLYATLPEVYERQRREIEESGDA